MFRPFAIQLASAENISIRSNGPVEVRSPGYPDSLTGEVDISWVILAAEDQKIRVSFNDPTTEVDDSWNVGDGDVVGLSTILSWDKRRRQLPDLLSTGRAIWVLFSSSSPTRKGFSLALSVVVKFSPAPRAGGHGVFDCLILPAFLVSEYRRKI